AENEVRQAGGPARSGFPRTKGGSRWRRLGWRAPRPGGAPHALRAAIPGGARRRWKGARGRGTAVEIKNPATLRRRGAREKRNPVPLRARGSLRAKGPV